MAGLVRVICDVEEGLIPSERIARVESADGFIEEVMVPLSSIGNGKLEASEIVRDKGLVLVELPRESASSGRWRVWVREALIGA